MGRERARVNKLTSAPKGRVELVYDSCVCAKRCDRDPLSIIADFIDTVNSQLFTAENAKKIFPAWSIRCQ